MIDINKSYTISEASDLIGYPNHVLRFYEKEFELEIPRNKSGHRYYSYIEMEKFLYIKTLKERGLSNKQIKTILNSPEEVINIDEIAATSYSANVEAGNDVIPINNSLSVDQPQNLIEIRKIIQDKLDDNFNNLSKVLVEEIQGTLNNFKDEYVNEDKDALISENARLKMKLKERAYEAAMLKDKLKRYENSKGSFLKRIFKSTNNGI
ncbi:MerR family transcriptional regulator [Wukongibacter baidiensis]|uniref:MerR family transcriptional regulator n=1 Tax=Wukongibacter baidiensis TaxID=1723361 RepID=UPI003D7F76F5